MILAIDSVARLYCIVRGPIPESMHAMRSAQQRVRILNPRLHR